MGFSISEEGEQMQRRADRVSAFGFFPFFILFSCPIEAKRRVNPIYDMRQTRLLMNDVWYEVRTAINNREPL
ncbi:MAG: hypothetical protein LBH70_04050, partial [Spirochaetaceae bacterium]|nr:hypothetical protein [Spirochaetaceae bacterium]